MFNHFRNIPFGETLQFFAYSISLLFEGIASVIVTSILMLAILEQPG
jgi:hypothetical protein